MPHLSDALPNRGECQRRAIAIRPLHIRRVISKIALCVPIEEVLRLQAVPNLIFGAPLRQANQRVKRRCMLDNLLSHSAPPSEIPAELLADIQRYTYTMWQSIAYGLARVSETAFASDGALRWHCGIHFIDESVDAIRFRDIENPSDVVASVSDQIGRYGV